MKTDRNALESRNTNHSWTILSPRSPKRSIKTCCESNPVAFEKELNCQCTMQRQAGRISYEGPMVGSEEPCGRRNTSVIDVLETVEALEDGCNEI